MALLLPCLACLCGGKGDSAIAPILSIDTAMVKQKLVEIGSFSEVGAEDGFGWGEHRLDQWCATAGSINEVVAREVSFTVVKNEWIPDKSLAGEIAADSRLPADPRRYVHADGENFILGGSHFARTAGSSLIYARSVRDAHNSQVIVKFTDNCGNGISLGNPFWGIFLPSFTSFNFEELSALHTDPLVVEYVVMKVLEPFGIGIKAHGLSLPLMPSRWAREYDFRFSATSEFANHCFKARSIIRYIVEEPISATIKKYFHFRYEADDGLGKLVMIIKVGMRLVALLMELHEVGFVHNDVHSDNVAMIELRNPVGSVALRLIDFGLSVYFPAFIGNLEQQVSIDEDPVAFFTTMLKMRLNAKLLSHWQLDGFRSGPRDDVVRALDTVATLMDENKSRIGYLRAIEKADRNEIDQFLQKESKGKVKRKPIGIVRYGSKRGKVAVAPPTEIADERNQGPSGVFRPFSATHVGIAEEPHLPGENSHSDRVNAEDQVSPDLPQRLMYNYKSKESYFDNRTNVYDHFCKQAIYSRISESKCMDSMMFMDKALNEARTTPHVDSRPKYETILQHMRSAVNALTHSDATAGTSY